MNESAMRSKVIKILKSLNAIAVENPALPGTPDINYVEGWIELKWLAHWPSRRNTTIIFHNFTPQQRVWHIRRRLAGGRSWILILVDTEWLLFDAADAALCFNVCDRNILMDLAIEHWHKKLDEEEFIKCICQDQRKFVLTASAKERLKQLLQSDDVPILMDI